MASKRKQYEGSKRDLTEDKRGAKQLNLPLSDYENTARDKAEDRKGQAKLSKKK
jgi:hypothetical protein